MKKLLSVPPNLIEYFHEIEDKDRNEWFCASDPPGNRIGSGGGTAWILRESWKDDDKDENFSHWLGKDKRIIIHAGGQSRRLPAYAPTGKILSPIPIFRWKRGQKIDQNLLDLQIPLYESILSNSPKDLNTLIASGDIFVRNETVIETLPEADVVCYALWVNPELASSHGVFVCKKNNPQELEYMLQKPSVKELQELSQEHLYLMDIGIWVLSDRAVEVLMSRSGYKTDKQGNPVIPEELNFFDLYAEFGLNLGSQSDSGDKEIKKLNIKIVPLSKGEFYHFGTSKELISSSISIQNRVMDQRSILHKDTKPHSSMFIQNADVRTRLHSQQRNLWIENSYIGEGWKIHSDHILTGIPENDWDLNLSAGICLDVIPVDQDKYCIRFYHYNDIFRGSVLSEKTQWLGKAFPTWLTDHGLELFSEDQDIQSAAIFPVLKAEEITGDFLTWIIDNSKNDKFSEQWKQSKRISANDLVDLANLKRLYRQRDDFRNMNIVQLHKNYKKSVFYQLDLDDIAKRVVENDLILNDVEPGDAYQQMHEYMFQARIKKYAGKNFKKEEKKAFSVLRKSIINSLGDEKQTPKLNVFKDQIVWGRSPVRIDIAGGWSDTPPYSLIHGGAVVNLAIELNGQPPLQTFIKPSKAFKIILRSIDIGTREDISTYEELAYFDHVGSEFAIPKAALYLSGFHPDFSEVKYRNLEEQLKEFGSGIEISTLAAIPKGSGLGTSSILAATVLGALSDLCGFTWSHNEISHRTLVLEQLLTTGGGWQDQYGGVLPGIKLLTTNPGNDQTPETRWAPDFLFTRPEYKARMLLYYTGITRTAKNILGEIVAGMFLNSATGTLILKEIKQHAFSTFNVLQNGDFDALTKSINKTWNQKKNLDKGTNPPEIQKLIKKFKHLASAYKLAGAGGGGYMFIIAKDSESAGMIRTILNENPPNDRSRFIDMDLSDTGFQVTRS